MLRIIAFPSTWSAGGYYRIVAPSTVLADLGHDVVVGPILDRVWAEAIHEGLLHDLAASADVVVFQRPIWRPLPDAIATLQSLGCAVTVDVDDDYSAVPEGSAMREALERQQDERGALHLQRCCDAADMVTVTTSSLAHVYGRHGRVRVLPNCIPAGYLRLDRSPGDIVRIGWSGNPATHPHDLEVPAGGVGRVVRSTGSRFSLIGPPDNVAQRLGLGAAMESTGWVPISSYPRALSRLDVGIVPLARSAFNESKSWLKGLEMAACGVPFVASATPEYRTLARLGAGDLAATPSSWEPLLARLVKDDRYREERAAAGRAVAEGLTVEARAHDWLEAWVGAVESRERRRDSASGK